jgi:hypothetical protein
MHTPRAIFRYLCLAVVLFCFLSVQIYTRVHLATHPHYFDLTHNHGGHGHHHEHGEHSHHGHTHGNEHSPEEPHSAEDHKLHWYATIKCKSTLDLILPTCSVLLELSLPVEKVCFELTSITLPIPNGPPEPEAPRGPPTSSFPSV